jgi:hypothetical protein
MSGDETEIRAVRIGIGASGERLIASGLMSNIVGAGLLARGLILAKAETIELAAFVQPREAEHERSAGF